MAFGRQGGRMRVICLASALVLVLAGCGSQGGSGDDAPAEAVTAETAASEAAVAETTDTEASASETADTEASASETADTEAPASEMEPLSIAATTTILGDIAANVAGDDAEITVLLPVGADPHDFLASSAQVALLHDADLVVANGLLLEESLIDVLRAVEADGVRLFEVGELLDPLPYGAGAGHDDHDEDEGEHDHDEGEGHDEDMGEHDHDEGEGHDEDEGEHDHDEGEGHDDEGGEHDHDEGEGHDDEGGEHDHDEGEGHDDEGGEHDHDEGEGHDEDMGEHDHDEGEGHDEDEGEHDHDEHGEGEDEGGEHEHEHDHGSEDPHFWMDPLRVAKAALHIADELNKIAPSPSWAERAEAYAASLEELDAEIRDLLASIPEENRKLITNHDAFGYFAARYDFEVVGTVIPGGSTLAEPSSADLAALVDAIVDEGVRAIFAETIEPSILAEAVAAEVGASVEVVELYSGSLGEPGTDAGTLIGMLRLNAERIAEALTP